MNVIGLMTALEFFLLRVIFCGSITSTSSLKLTLILRSRLLDVFPLPPCNSDIKADYRELA